MFLDSVRGPRPGLQAVEPPAYARGVQIGVLGTLEAHTDGVSVRLGGPKQRTVLAILVAEGGRSVPIDRLVDLVWGEEPPTGARSTLHTYISNLRAALGDVVVRDGGGYRLDLPREAVDAFRFEDDVARARETRDSQPLEAAQRLREALKLWRGRPYADVSDSPFLEQEARRLEELRLTAIENRVDAELALGNHAELVGELEVLTAENPLREHLRAAHMLALYRAGRQAEALRAYHKTRTLLAEELGIDPSPALQELEGKILRQDHSLDLESEPRVETLVFLLSDIEDSTVLWELHQREMGPAVALYDAIVSEAVEGAGGRVVKRVGDGLDAVFSDAGGAVVAAREAQRALQRGTWGETGPLKARMAIDVGEVEARGGGYFGPVLNRCGRILASGHGGQILLSAEAHAALSGAQAGWQVRALGEFRFKGLGRPQRVFQLLVDDLPTEFPELRIDRLPATARISVERAVRGYELREQVGGGDFGVVYRAYQPAVGREVAVKVIRPEFVNQPSFVRRFESEAQMVAQLEHPHIVALYDYWRDPDGAYLVMRWLRGGALSDALDRGPWHLEPASRLLAQVGSALAYAHRQGIVHRDLKPGNVLLDEEGNAYLSDFGVAARLVDASESGRPVSSSPAYVTPEELRGEPLRAPSDIFALGLLTFELLSGRRPPMDRSLPSLRRLRPELPEGIDEIIARATADQPAARYSTVDGFLAAFLDVLGQAPVAEEAGFTPTRNPYKGLQAFSEFDEQDFHGRQGLIEELTEALKKHRFLAVVGPSGIGKSSVVRAGLVPALRAGALPGSRDWLVTDMFPGSYPFEELEAALLRIAVERPVGMTEDLARDERGILRVSKRILPTSAQAMLVIDQFEELFTLTSDEETRRLFLDALATLVTDPRSRMRVVITLRADFFDRPLRYRAFGDLLRDRMVAVTAPGEGELTAAIVRPAEAVGVRFEAGLVDRIITDVSSQPGALPLLQYALTELFASRTSDLLTVHGYQASGRVLGALGRRAEELYESLDEDGREAARQVFLRLVAVSEVGEDTRRRVRHQELDALGVDALTLDEVLRRYGEYRLLTFDRDPLTRGPTVEVAHEALLTEWHRLRDWIAERREDLLLQRRLADALGEWEQAGRDASYLLSGGRLQQFAAWADGTDLALTTQEREYLHDSEAAEAERRRLQRRRRRAIMAGFGAAAALSLVLAAVAYLNERQALHNEQLAHARELAAAAISVRDTDPELSILLSIAAHEAAPDGEAPPREVVSVLHQTVRSSRMLVSRPWEADFGLSWSPLGGSLSPDGTLVAASGWSDTLQVWDAATGEVRWELRDDESGGWFWWPQFSPDGSRLVVAFSRYWEEGRRVDGGLAAGIYFFHSRNGELLDMLPPPTECDWVGMAGPNALSLDGNHLIRLVDRGGEDPETGCYSYEGPENNPLATRELEVVDIRTLEVVYRTDVTYPYGENRGHGQAGVDIAGNRLIVGDLSGDHGTTRMIDLVDGSVLWERAAVGGFLSPDGSVAALAGGGAAQRRIELVDPATGDLLGELVGHRAHTDAVVFSRDGRLAYSAGMDGTARVWDVATGENLLTLGGDKQGLISLSPDESGARLATFGFDGNTRMWDLTAQPLTEVGTAIDLRPAQVALRGIMASGGLATVAGFLGECPDQEGFSIVFNAETGTTMRRFTDSAGQMEALLPDGTGVLHQLLVLYGPEISCADEILGPLVIRDLTSGETRIELEGWCEWADPGDCASPPEVPYADFVNALAVSDDGRIAVAGGPSGAASIWDVHEGSLHGTIGPFQGEGWIQGVAVHPDGRTAVVTSSEALYIVDLDSALNIRQELRSHHGFVAFNPGGSLLAVGEPRLTMYRTEDWEVMWEVDAHDGGVPHLGFSPDGTALVTTGPDGFVRLWSATDGNLLQVVPLGDDWAKAVAFVNERHVLIGTSNGLVVGLTFDVDELVEIGRSRVTRSLTDQECRTYLRIDECPSDMETTASQ